MKIQIIGFSGSGKSTLAKQLGKHYNLPVLHLDTVQFFGNWEVRPKTEQNNIVEDFMENNPSGWVIDGNYSNLARHRFEQADLIIYLKFNRFICYTRNLFRYLSHRGQVRESLGCVEKFDWEFQRWILFDGRTKEIRQKHQINFNMGKGEKFIFKNSRQVKRFLKSKNII